jgi:hypothetical protein
LYVIAAAAEAVFRFTRPHDVPFLGPATAGYWVCLPVLIGSVASAEERQLGTISWQQLLPAPAWQQWAAKAGTVFGLALVLGIAVPALVLQLPGLDDRLARGLPALPAAMILAFVLSAVGLYVSSLSRSAVIAVMISFAAITAFLLLADIFAPAVARTLFQPPFGLVHEADRALAMLAVAAVLLVRFAFVNHRSEDPGTARAWRQTMWLTGFVAFAILLIESRPF